MKKSVINALSSMNYLFLKEVFKDEFDSKVRDSYYKFIICEELNLFLRSLSEDDWSEDFKKIVKIELSEGSYLDNVNGNLSLIENKFKEAIIRICDQEDLILLEKYMSIVKSI